MHGEPDPRTQALEGTTVWQAQRAPTAQCSPTTSRDASRHGRLPAREHITPAGVVCRGGTQSARGGGVLLVISPYGIICLYNILWPRPAMLQSPQSTLATKQATLR